MILDWEKFWSLSSIPSFVLPLLITLTLIQRKSSGHETEVGRRRDLNCHPIFSRADHKLLVRRFNKRRYAPKQIPVSPREQTLSHFDSGMNLLSPNPGQSPTRRVRKTKQKTTASPATDDFYLLPLPTGRASN